MEMTFQNSHNPLLLPQFHVPDGEAHVMPDGKLYIYGSYDDCELAYCSDFYRVISTPDMKTWTVHQKAMEGAAVPWFREDMAGQVYGTDEAPDTPFIRMMNAAIADDPDKDYFGNLVERERTALLYAPDGAHKDGKYYLYFCMEDGSEGVGISDRPEGPFGDFRQLPAQGIDPAILVDDDGNAYYFWGQFSARGVKLNPDIRSLICVALFAIPFAMVWFSPALVVRMLPLWSLIGITLLYDLANRLLFPIYKELEEVQNASTT